MPSEQKGAYGGHLALLSFDMERMTDVSGVRCRGLGTPRITPEGVSQ